MAAGGGVDPRVIRAARKYGHRIDGYARKHYGLSGATLLVKLVKGEHGAGKIDMGRTSSAGAKGPTQFMPGTRRAVVQKTNGKVDPYRSIDEAVYAATMHLRGELGNAKGLAGYNPGMPSYTNYILGQQVGHIGGGSSRGGSPSPSGGSRSRGGSGASQQPQMPGFDPGQAQQPVLQQAQTPAMYPTSGVAPPSFAAGPVGIGGGRIDFGSLTTGPPSPPSTLDLTPQTQPAQFGTPEQIAQEQAAGGGGGRGGRGGGGRGGQQFSGGSMKITGPNPGRIKPGVRKFMRQISAVAGERVVGSDGTGHSKYTVNGNVSAHFTGNASDIPAAGAHLTRLGQAALIAAGMSKAKARKTKGGLFNIGGYQIIFNTNEGGNHYDHLHVGLRR